MRQVITGEIPGITATHGGIKTEVDHKRHTGMPVTADRSVIISFSVRESTDCT